MKKIITTIAIILGMAFGATAQESGMFSNENKGGGLFQRGYVSSEEYYEGYHNERLGLMLGLPNHLMDDDQDAPLGSGIALLFGMGAAYAFAKKRKEG